MILILIPCASIAQSSGRRTVLIFGFPKIIAAWKETKWGEPQLLNKLDVDEVELVLPVPSVKSSTTELSKGLSETAANIYKMIYADNYITRSDIANRIGISVTAVQKHINKLKSLKFLDRDGSTGHGSWIVIE